MFDTLFVLPASFWVVVAVLCGGFVWGTSQIRKGTGLPVLAVLFTVAAWYAGDALYNDYGNHHVDLFTSRALNDAWWQVALFLMAFLLMASGLHKYINRGYLRTPSRVMQIWQAGVGNQEFQRQLTRLFYASAAVWVVLSVIATIRLQEEIPYYFFPFLGYKAEPWGRGRVGGDFDALLSFAGYFQLFVAGAFGLMAALIKERRIILFSIIGIVLTWPYYLFDRTRNTMLAVVLPGVMTWVFLRYRGNFLNKILILALCFIVTESWLAFVLANRTTSSIATAFSERGFSLKQDEKRRHDGLNMYEELCWINTFIEDGSYEPNWGARYFAELVNPIPRGLWEGKPFIGIDYSIARGQGNASGGQAGVNATVATGMIGQGVVNFGRFGGPVFAAFLMSLWVAMLARLDLTGEKVGRIPLYAFSLFLTFNLGRDITFLTLYSFVFGWLLVMSLDRIGKRRQQNNVQLSDRPLAAQ
jgi:hypothetical protein